MLATEIVQEPPVPSGGDSPLGKRPCTQGSLRKAVFDAARLLERRLDSPPTVQELALAAGVSEFHFHRAFRAVVGETVARHGLRLRIERAARFLKFSSWQVLEIALVSGFSTQSSFTRAFTRLYSMSPQAFRRNNAVVPFLRARMRSRPDREMPLPGFPLPTVRIEQWPVLEAVCLRSYAPMNRIDQPWSEMLTWARAQVPALDRARFFGLWYDDWRDGAEPTYRYDCAVLPAGPLTTPPPAPFTLRKLPPGTVAVATTNGRLDDLERAWKAFTYGWLPFSGYQPRGRYVLDEYSSEVILSSEPAQIVSGRQNCPLQMCLPVQDTLLEL